MNGFGEGPKMRYVLEAVEDDVSAEDSTSVMGTSIYKASYGSYCKSLSSLFGLFPLPLRFVHLSSLDFVFHISIRMFDHETRGFLLVLTRAKMPINE